MFRCPTVVEIWRILGLQDVVHEVCAMEREGGSVLADLLLSTNTTMAHVSDVQHNDLVATTI